MSVDILQDRIRRLKNPSMLDLTEIPMDLPLHILQQENTMVGSYRRFCLELLETMKDLIPAVRVPFSAFAMLGPEGLSALTEILGKAGELGYYVTLDAPEVLSPLSAQITAQALLGSGGLYPCDGLILPVYAGSDVIKPFVPFCKKQEKDIFCVARTGNKSASELQDLLAGSRVVHMAAADLVNRYTPGTVGKRGYARVGILAGASSSESIRILREKYPQLFLVLDGADYPNANAKNCSNAFDQFGHGAVCSIGTSVTGAWKNADSDGQDYLDHARSAAERMRKNFTRYVTIL